MTAHGIDSRFFIIARERGRHGADLPTWADRGPGTVEFDAPTATQPARRDVRGVPGAFQIIGLLSAGECSRFIDITEALGYHEDAPVSLPHSVRHNTNVNWVVNEHIDSTLWQRFSHLVPEGCGGESAIGLNARFRFYRYATGDFFEPHTDGAWPGSRVVGDTLVHDAYGDRLSQMTCLLFLSEGHGGGATLFFVDAHSGGPTSDPRTAAVVRVETPLGGALCFPHGFHPAHCLHAGEAVTEGVKYIIRTDILFRLPVDERARFD